MKEELCMDKDKRRDILFIGGFASIFHFLGFLTVLIFSIRTTLECNRTQDICSLSSEYVLRDPDQQTWAFSEMKRAYIETQYPTGTPEEQWGKSTYYRATMALQYKKVPFQSKYSTNREKIQNLWMIWRALSLEIHRMKKIRKHLYIANINLDLSLQLEVD